MLALESIIVRDIVAVELELQRAKVFEIKKRATLEQQRKQLLTYLDNNQYAIYADEVTVD
jgi:hypothetical protein